LENALRRFKRKVMTEEIIKEINNLPPPTQPCTRHAFGNDPIWRRTTLIRETSDHFCHRWVASSAQTAPFRSGCGTTGFGGKPIRLDKEANRGSERKLSKMGSFAVFLFHPFDGISAPIVAVAVSANAIIW
jgi:Ribosomal protein S21